MAYYWHYLCNILSSMPYLCYNVTFNGHFKGLYGIEDTGKRMAIVIPTTEKIHREALQASITVIASVLQELLSRRLTAYIAGVKDGKTVTRWAKGEVTDLRHESEQKLRTAYEIAQLLTSHFDSPGIVKSWFIGLDPYLDDTSPAEAVHEGRLREALSAARIFISGQ